MSRLARLRRNFWAQLALGVVIVAPMALWIYPVLLSNLIGDNYTIPSQSMHPTLMQGDWMIATHVRGLPRRGDVVIFTNPRPPRVEYVKRVVGLPGDRVAMANGVLVLNGAPVGMERLDHPHDDGAAAWRETLPEGQHYTVLDRGATAGDNTAVREVPAGHVFVLGDNRDNSMDSRFDPVGMIPLDALRHRAWFVHTSIDWDVGVVRWDRLFKRVHRS